MPSVGEKLQGARVELGLDLASVATLTKINPKYLKAIEADDRASLPSAFFYKSFVHQYASALSLDPKEFDSAIDAVVNAEAPLPLPGQEPRESRSLPRLKIGGYKFYRQSQFASYVALGLVLLGCSGIYSWWHKKSDKATAVAATSSPKVAPALAVVAAPAPAALKTSAYRVLLQLLAREKTWLSVASDGRTVFSGILAPNESKNIEGKEYAKLKVGNAAGLEVRLNGKLISPLGGRGQVLVVLFHPDNFVIVPQAPKEGD
jgi:cytoskeleton protein RodZ